MRQAFESIADLIEDLVTDLEAGPNPALPSDRTAALRAGLSRIRGVIARTNEPIEPPTAPRRRPDQRKR